MLVYLNNESPVTGHELSSNSAVRSLFGNLSARNMAANVYSSQAEKENLIIAAILTSDAFLNTVKDLSPRNPAVTETIRTLFHTLHQPLTPAEINQILSDPRVKTVGKRLLRNVSQAQGEMEFYFSISFANSPFLQEMYEHHFSNAFYTNYKIFEDFIFWNKFEKLVKEEVSALGQCFDVASMKPAESIAMVGSGPLPLTSIIMHNLLGVRVTCIDINEEAIRVSSQLVKKLGLEEHIKFVVADGLYHTYTNHPVVFIAGYVPPKAAILEKIRSDRPKAIVAVRNADGIFAFLYE